MLLWFGPPETSKDRMYAKSKIVLASHEVDGRWSI